MPHLHAETFRTDLIAAPRRLAFWNEVAHSTFGDIAVDARAADFSAQLKRVRVGGLVLASVLSSPARVSGASSQNGWFLLLNERGVSRMTQGAREAYLQPGELTVLRSDAPYRIEFSRPNKTLVLGLPSTARLDLDRHVARTHSAGEVPLFAALMRQLEALDAAVDLPRLDQMVLDIARLSWPAERPRREPLASWEHRVRAYIEENLSDTQLSAASIAEHFNVSTRYIHMVFARMGQTAAAFILELRLANAAERLRTDPAARITDVAMDAGFTDLSVFCRAFRRRFGTSARRYRA